MPKKVTVSPGEKVEVPGQYRPEKGGSEVTIPGGHKAPPTPDGGDWILVDPTETKRTR
jgi:hypothetical protein